MKKRLKLCLGTNSLNSSTDFTTWSDEQIRRTIFELKDKIAAYNCTLRVTSVMIELTNETGDSFYATLGDDWSIESVEFNMSGSSIRGDLSELDEITEQAFEKMNALNELKKSWKDVSQWLDLLAYAKEHNLNSSHRTSVNSSWGKVLPYSGKFYKSGEPVGEFAYHAGSGSWNIYPKDSNDLHWLSEAEVLDGVELSSCTALCDSAVLPD